MESIHKLLGEIDTFTEGDVLATIIHVEGSAYQREGTSMLFRCGGSMVGTLSAGCLEVDLSIRIKEGLAKEEIISFDMRSEDDLSWGQGSGCNGMIQVLLEPINAQLNSHLQTLKSNLLDSKSVVMIKRLTKESELMKSIFLTEDGKWFGGQQEDLPTQMLDLIKGFEQSSLKSGLKFINEISESIYIHRFKPKPRLVLFGAGHDAVPLARMATDTGFSVTVTDWRPALCNIKNFPNVDQLIVGFPHNVINEININSNDTVIVLTHNFQKDKQILKHLIKKDIRYLGVLGSKARTARLLDGEGEINCSIHSPVGLSIGAEGPEQIAISILAELIKIQNLEPSRMAIPL